MEWNISKKWDLGIYYMGFRYGLIGYAVQDRPLFLQVDLYILPFFCLQFFKIKKGDREIYEHAKKYWNSGK